MWSASVLFLSASLRRAYTCMNRILGPHYVWPCSQNIHMYLYQTRYIYSNHCASVGDLPKLRRHFSRKLCLGYISFLLTFLLRKKCVSPAWDIVAPVCFVFSVYVTSVFSWNVTNIRYNITGVFCSDFN